MILRAPRRNEPSGGAVPARLRGAVLPVAALAAVLLVAAGCAGGRGSSARPGATEVLDLRRQIALADSAIAAGDAGSARRALDRALGMAPDSAFVHLARGRFYTAIRRFKDAKASYDRAAALDPRSPEPFYQLGLAYLAAGDREGARNALARSLSVDPGHAKAREALAGILGDRYVAAGIPSDYPKLGGHNSVSRGELGVLLAVELGIDPDRTAWRSDEIQRIDWPELDESWGSRWLRAALMRHWITAYADGSFHLDDPVTRGQLALTVAQMEGEARSGGARAPIVTFQDLGARHYLARPASRAYRLGLPLRAGGRFEPMAAATGAEAVQVVRGLARALGATPVVSSEPDSAEGARLMR
jgi:hypothetical protein